MTQLSIYLILFGISLFIFPKDLIYKCIFFLFLLDPKLNVWGTFLTLQIIIFLLISSFFEKEEFRVDLIKEILYFLVILFVQAFYASKHFNLLQPIYICAMFTGACIFYLCSSKRPHIFPLIFF